MKTKREKNMKKGIALVALLITAGSTIHAERVLEESFDYMLEETLDEKGGWSTSHGRKLEITNSKIRNCTFKNNTFGAGIHKFVSAGPNKGAMQNDSRFTGNPAFENNIFIDNTTAIYPVQIFTNCII